MSLLKKSWLAIPVFLLGASIATAEDTCSEMMAEKAIKLSVDFRKTINESIGNTINKVIPKDINAKVKAGVIEKETKQFEINKWSINASMIAFISASEVKLRCNNIKSTTDTNECLDTMYNLSDDVFPSRGSITSNRFKFAIKAHRNTARLLKDVGASCYNKPKVWSATIPVTNNILK